MKSAIFVLNGLKDSVDPEHYSTRFRQSGMDVQFAENVEMLQGVPHDAVIIAEGRFFPETLSVFVEAKRKDLSVVGVTPVWSDEIKDLLPKIEFPVMLITGHSDLSVQGVSTMKYHDRIAGSIVRYLKRSELEMRHPDRIVRLLEEWLNDR